jgi:uncharacterized repeat protein (TIGR04076 family)
MSHPYKIMVRVLSVDGHCQFGHEPGDQIVFDGERVNGRVCLHALYSFLPKVFAMRYGASFPWIDEEHRDVSTHACPDAHNPVVFEVRRIRDPVDQGEDA